MGDREKLAEGLLARQLSRRALLKAGAAVPLGAGMLAIAGRGTAFAQEAPDLSGTTLRVWAGGTTGGPATQAATEFGEMTGAEVLVEAVPFDERALRFAGLIAGQDGSIDVLHTNGQFAGQFGDRLYENLSDPQWAIDTAPFVPATLTILTSDGGLRGLPLYSEILLYIYNKTMFEAAGLDPDAPPDNWPELYEAAAALTDGDRFPAQVPWQVSYGSAAFWVPFLNSIPAARVLSDDRTQVLFGGEDGLQSFQTVEAGNQAGFFDSNLAPDIEDYAIGTNFNNARTASQTNFAELWGYAVGGNPTDFPTILMPEEVGVTIMPGNTPGTSGSVNGFEGFGLNKFGTQKEAALAFIQYLSGLEFQRAMTMAKTLPSSRNDVLTDPEIQAVYPIGEVLAEQAEWNVDRYASPYDWTPPVSDALGKLYRGEIDAAQAHEEAVAGVEEIVLTWLSS